MTAADPHHQGPASEAGLLAAMERLGYRVSRHVYPPGTRFATHTHAVDKLDAVLEGRLVIQMDGQERELGPGDMMVIPAGREHAAWVTGPRAVISLDGVRQNQ